MSFPQLPEKMKAIKVKSQGVAEVVEVPLPKMRDDYLLVKVSNVALNPTDWKHIAYLPTIDATVGCDLCGTVEQVGSAVTKAFHIGQRVAGFAHGVNSLELEDGSFAEYALIKGDVAMRVPENMSDEEACTIGVGILTVGQGLYQSLKLPMPDAKDASGTFVLVYGASTATGLWALQYAKLSGLTPIATCRPHNFDLVKANGAAVAFDYSDPTACAKSIRDFTNNSLSYAFDCISEGVSLQICADSLSPAPGGRYSALLPVKFPRDDVASASTLAYTVIGERIVFRGGVEIPASNENFEFGKKMVEQAEGLIQEGKLRAVPVDVREGGLLGVLGGLEDLKNGKVSGKKLVYRIGS